MQRGKAIAPLFLQNSESFKGNSILHQIQKVPKGKAIGLLFFQYSEISKRFLNFTPNSKSITSDCQFVPKGKAIALLLAQNLKISREI